MNMNVKNIQRICEGDDDGDANGAGLVVVVVVMVVVVMMMMMIMMMAMRYDDSIGYYKGDTLWSKQESWMLTILAINIGKVSKCKYCWY